MKKNNLPIIFLIFIISTCAYSKISDLQSNTIMPIEWQAIQLQENIESKIIRSLNPIIKESDYIIEVKIVYDKDKAELPSSKKYVKNKQSKKIKFNNSELPKDGDDFIVFNKLGLEAPLVGEEPVEIETSEVEQSQQAMIEMNDRYNLFNFLNAIEIKLTFDKGLSGKTKESINKIINGISFNTKDVVTQINTQYLDLKASKVKNDDLKQLPMSGKAEAEKNGIDKWGERFKNLDIMLGLICSAILLGIVALVIARMGSKHEGVEENKSDNTNNGLNEDIVQEETIEENSLAKEDDMDIDLTKTDAQTLKIVAGLERFRKVYSHHYNDMILLLKSWIKVGKGQEAEALKGLVATLTDSELSEIFKGLTIDERGAWKICLNSEMNKEEIAKAFTFISNKIIEAMMVPSLIEDYEVCDLLLDLSGEDAARFCMDHPELGGVFANVLSAKVIGRMFEIMPVHMTADIIEKSSAFKKEEVIKQMPLLKEKLIEIKLKRERPPFLKRIFDILPNAKPEIERKLYSTLITHCSLEDVRETAMKIFPQDLIHNVSEVMFKNILTLMSFENQVMYFAMCSDDIREERLSKFAPEGTKNREMLTIEINSLTENELKLKRVQQDRKDEIDKEYINCARSYISSDNEAQMEVKALVDQWLKSIKEEVESTPKVA